jgi:hypothetical protein
MSAINSPTSLDVSSGMDMESALASGLASEIAVRHVFIERADRNLVVWIAVDDPTKEVLERVFRKELSLMDGFPEINFDFNVVSGRNREPGYFAPDARLIFSREG